MAVQSFMKIPSDFYCLGDVNGFREWIYVGRVTIFGHTLLLIYWF